MFFNHYLQSLAAKVFDADTVFAFDVDKGDERDGDRVLPSSADSSSTRQRDKRVNTHLICIPKTLAVIPATYKANVQLKEFILPLSV